MIFLLGFESGGFQFSLLKIAQEYNLSGTEMGTLVGTQFLAMMIMPVVFGRIADAAGKKKIIIIFAQCFAVGCLVLTAAFNYYWILSGIFFMGSGYSVCESMLTAGLFDEYPGQGISYAGKTQGFFAAGAVSGPLVSSYLMQMQNRNSDWRTVFYIIAVFSVICGSMMIFVPIKKTEEKPVKSRILNFNNTGNRKNNHRHRIQKPVFRYAVLMVCYVGIETGIAYFLDSYLNTEFGNSTMASWLISGFWLMMIPGRFCCGIAKGKEDKYLKRCFFSVTVLVLAWQLCSSMVLLTVIILLAGISCGMVWPLLMGRANSYGDGNSGCISGLMTMGSGFGGALWPILFGWIMDFSGIKNAMGLLAGTGCLALFILIFKQRNVRKIFS